MYLLILLGFLALLIVDLLIALAEGVSLTLLNWNPFRTSMTVSVIMNIASGLVNGILLILLQNNPLVWIPVSFALSLLIELFVLSYFKRDAIRQNIIMVLMVNIVSYTLLILPAYYYGIRS